jgi:holo-[acyl-carrier protein] synthase
MSEQDAGQEAAGRLEAAHVGLDLVEIERFERALARHALMEERLFTPGELAYCRSRAKPILHLAARFAAKEAIGKLLRTGVISWGDIEVLGPGSAALAGGAPVVRLTGATAEKAAALGIAEVRVSLSHVDSMAGACVVAVACSFEGAIDGRLLDL